MKVNGRRIFRILRRFLLWTAASLLLLVLLSALLLYLFQDKLEQKLISRLNKQLVTEIEVKNIDFTLFKNFPYITADFQEVKAKDATPKKEDYLLQAHEVLLEFNLFDLIWGEYTIQRLQINRGEINLRVYGDGTDNYHFWKADTLQTADSSDFRFDLQRIKLVETSISYINIPSGQQYSFMFTNAKAAGRFSEKEFAVDLKGTFRVNRMLIGEINYLAGSILTIDALMEANTETDTYVFSKGEIGIGEVFLELLGTIIWSDAVHSVNMQAQSPEVPVKDFISLIPAQYAGYAESFSKEGSISVKAELKGLVNDHQQPALNVGFELENGRIEQPKTGVALSNLKANGTLIIADISRAAEASLKLNSFSANLDGDPISGRGILKNFGNPKLEAEVKATLSLEKLSKWIGDEWISSMSGKLDLDFKFNGLLTDLSNPGKNDFLNSKSEGILNVTNASVVFSAYPVPLKDINLKARFSNSDLKIDQLDFQYGSSDFSMTGYFRKFLPYVFGSDVPMELQASLLCKHLDPEDLMVPSSESEGNGFVLTLPKNIKASLDLEVGSFQYRKFRASNVSARVKLVDQVLSAGSVRMITLDGVIEGYGKIDASKNDLISVSCEAELLHVELSQAFEQFGNFGQTSMTNENIHGRASIRVQFSSQWSENLVVDENSIRSVAQISIENGQILNYEPLIGLSEFAKGRNFRNVSFETLKNDISIQNRVITIPEMEIRSSAMNIIISGRHTFDNEIEYHVEIRLSELRKPKNQKPDAENEYGYVEDDGLGGTTIYILITGTVDDPIYNQLDKEAIKENIKESIREEKQNLKGILNKEFGWFEKDTSLNQDAGQPKQDTRFQIEWEDE